jgi:hypothetical protein
LVCEMFANQIANQPPDIHRYRATQSSTVGAEMPNQSTR